MKVACIGSLDSCLLMDNTMFLRLPKAVSALTRSIGLLQMLMIVVSLTWSNTRVPRRLYSSGDRPASEARVVASRSVAVELARPTTWKGRLTLSRVILGVANITLSTTLRKSVSSKVFSFMQYLRREMRRGSISGTLRVIPLKTSSNRAISSARIDWLAYYYRSFGNVESLSKERPATVCLLY